MALKYADVKKILAQYAGRGGKCYSEDSVEVDLFTREVLQQMLFKGAYGHQHTYEFRAHRGCITLPYELQTPIKVQIDDVPGDVWDRWYEFYPQSQLDLQRCVEANRALIEMPNRYATVYDVPAGGARIAVVATAEEAPDATVVIQGLDRTGREIVVNHEGAQIYGETLRLRRGEFRYTQAIFSKVTGIQKGHTNGYVQLLWYNADTHQRGYLSDYTPFEESPSYRRYRLTTPCHDNARVLVLGRIRIKDRYANNEFIPFDNLLAIRLAGQKIHGHVVDDENVTQAKDNALNKTLVEELTYNKPGGGGQPIEIQPLLAGSAIKNIVGYRRY